MPTCSTSKLPSKYQTGGAGLFYKRYRRPQSCKYDTYRTRSRRSVVDETLFGEPLNKQLLARSKSMETISTNDENKSPTYNRNTKVKGVQRPKTALATMRVANREPEFSSPNYSPPPRKELKPVGASIIITSSDWRMIQEAARVMSPEEKAALSQENSPGPGDRKPASPWAIRRSIPLPETRTSPETTEIEDSPRDEAFLQRAKELREENIAEVRKINEFILSAKCNTVLDTQVAEKNKRLSDLVELNKNIDTAVEEERKKAEEMTTERNNAMDKFYKDYKNQLQQQLDEVEAERLLKKEKKDREAIYRRKAEEAMREDERKEKEQKQKLKLQLQEQFRNENEELKKRKKEEEEWHKANDQRIRDLEEKRRQVEEEREKLEKEIKKRRDAEVLKVAVYGERETDLNIKREEIRLQRQKEEKEREWRQQQMDKAKINQERQLLINETRKQQIELKKQLQAESAKVDRNYWENQISAWRDSVDEARLKEDQRQQAKLQYQRDLQIQMENNNNIMKQKKTEDQEWARQQDMKKMQHQENVSKVMERKLQQLKAYNIPEKYVKQIERRFDTLQNAKFTKAYHGKK